MKKINYLLFIFVVFLFGASVSLAKTFTLVADGESCDNCINDYDYIVGTHVFTFEYINENDFTTQMLMYASSTLDGSSLDNIKMYMYFGNGSMYDVISFNTETIPLTTTYEITHVNGVCIDPSCLGEVVDVTFKYNDSGLTPDVSETLAYKSLVDEPVNPTKLGHKFTCWTVEGSDDCFDFNTPIETDTVLEASWEIINYEVTYVDTVSKATKKVQCNFSAGNMCEYPEFTDLFTLAEGYTFNGWALAETGEKVYTAGSNFENLFGEEAEFTLYSIFNSSDYIISYNLKGGTFDSLQAPTTVYDPSVLEYDISTPSRVGYVFKGWNVTEGSAVVQNNKIKISAVSNIEIEATWEPIKYNMVYNKIILNNTVCEYDKVCVLDLSKIKVESGKEIVSMTAIINGTNYNIGTNVKNIISSRINNAEISTIEVNVEIDDIKYAVSYDLNGAIMDGGAIYPSPVLYNKAIAITEPSRTGYIFNGWSVIKGTAKVTNNSITLTEAKDAAIRANWTPIEYNVVYNGVNLNSATCVYDAKCELDFDLIEVPDGKEITDITVDVNGNKIKLGSPVLNLIDEPLVNEGASDVDVTVTFDDIKYNVSYDLNGALKANNASYPSRVALNSTVTFTEPTRTGYTFDGWTVSPDGVATVTNTSLKLTKAQDVTIKANWTPIEYNVVYNNVNLNKSTCEYDKKCDLDFDLIEIPDGKEISSITVNVNNKEIKLGSSVLNLIDVPLVGSGVSNVAVTVTFDDIKYNVSYDLNGALKANNASYPSRVALNGTVTFTEPTREGYTFGGWTVSPKGAATVTNTTLTLNKTDDVTIKAKWNANTYNLVYNKKNYGQCTFDESCTLINMSPGDYPEGKNFLYWTYNDKVLGDVVYNLATSGDVTLTPVFENVIYNINYDYDGGEVVTANTSTYDIDTADITLNVPTKEGYDFTRWSITSTTNKAYVFENTLLLNSSTEVLNVKANYTAKEFEVVYDVNGGTGTIDSHICYYNNCIITDIVPEKSGYVFEGWLYDETGYIYESGSSVTIDAYGEVTLTAKWSNKDAYKVNYHLNGGTFDGIANTKFFSEESVTLTKPSKTGYTFAGWVTDSTLVSEEYIEEVPVGVTNDYDVYAKWTPNAYSVTYKVADYLGDDVVVNYMYDEVSSLNNYTDDFADLGYAFMGWSKTENGSLYYGTDIEFKNLEGGLSNINLYPVIEVTPDDYVISYYLDGGNFVDETSVVRSYNNGETLTLPEVAKVGYVVDKWILEDGTVVDGTETDINRDVVLIPVWIPDVVTLNFYSTDTLGNHVYTMECSLFSECSFMYELSLTDRVHTGWKLTLPGEGGSTVFGVEDSFVPNLDYFEEGAEFVLNLYAQFTPKTYNISYHNDNGDEIDFTGMNVNPVMSFTNDKPFVQLTDLDVIQESLHSNNWDVSNGCGVIIRHNGEYILQTDSCDVEISTYSGPSTSTNIFVNLYNLDNVLIGVFEVTPNGTLVDDEAYVNGYAPDFNGVAYYTYNWKLNGFDVDLSQLTVYRGIDLYLDPANGVNFTAEDFSN